MGTYLPIELIRYILLFYEEWRILFGYYFINTKKLLQIYPPIYLKKNGFTISMLTLPINEKSYSLVYNNINFVVAIVTRTPLSNKLGDIFYSKDRKTWKPYYIFSFLNEN